MLQQQFWVRIRLLSGGRPPKRLLLTCCTFLRTVQQAVTPTSDLPAPHGSTITPDLYREILDYFTVRYQRQGVDQGRVCGTPSPPSQYGTVGKY